MNRLENVIAAIAYIEKHLTEKMDLDIVNFLLGYRKFRGVMEK